MRVTFDGTTDEVVTEIIQFLDAFAGTTTGPGEVAVEAEVKPKRTRRTKEQIAADKADKEADTAPAEEAAPATRRRTRDTPAEADTTPEAPPAEEVKPATRRRRSAPAEEAPPAEDPGLTDEDLTKAASEAASTITPKAVKDLLGEFGVIGVQELGEDVRQEFLDLLKDAVDEAKG